MNIIDQNNALIAQETALVSDSALIDNRTEIDRLAFLSNFATVINFYDHENKINGDWRPFLLKDPAILLAHISKTKIDKHYRLYRDTCNKIEFCLSEDKISRDLVINVDHLFDELITLFVMLESWTYYMNVTTTEYELKKYTCHQVKQIYSKYFWALLSLRQNLSRVHYRYKIKPVRYDLYDDFDKVIWKQNMDKSPYWDILELDHQLNNTTKPSEIYQAIKKAGDKLFSFLEAIVAFAPNAYENVKTIKGKYPDTLLIRAFVSLLTNYNNQLNDIGNKHLEFYYKDILKQHSTGALPDQVLLFANLAQANATFTLTSGTLFNGGFDEQKKPILFETLTDINLNPATISGAYVLSRTPESNNLTPIQKIEDPTVIQKDVDGRVKSWKFFGDGAVIPADQDKVGFVISSPLLLLREGLRTITLTGSTFSSCDWSKIKLYLSTDAGWFEIADHALSFNENNVAITLQISDPAIVTFPKNPEKLEVSWPMLKIAFDTLTDFKKVMNTLGPIDLQVDVSGMKNLQFYNDFGAITPKNPYEPFGPIPLLNSSFIMGSDEIFSKPISAFNIEIDWNNLPEDSFSTYYQIYDKYLSGKLVYKGWLSELKKVFSKKDLVRDKFFFNKSFTCEMQLLHNSTWKTLNMFKYPNLLATKKVADEGEIDPKLDPTLYLFNGTNDKLEKNSSFYFHPKSDAGSYADPELGKPQLQNLPQFKYTADSTDGFMKIILSGNKYGFGAEIYPNVVAQVATYNAWMITHSHSMTCLVPSAKLPFAPKISSFIVNYTAATVLNNSKSYPYQCYTFSPFSNEPFSLPDVVPNVATNHCVDVTGPLLTNDFLFSTKFGGFLFLELDQLVPSDSVSLYFGLAPSSTGRKLSDTSASYYYLNDEGWNAVSMITDDTANFNCSGIVNIVIPAAISQQKFIGTDKKYWLCIAATSNSDTFPELFLLKTNGFLARRYSGGASTNPLPSHSITKSQTLIPQISAITQPFPSFGGIAAESEQQMNQRVSLRLKTKDRAVTAADYFRLVQKNFPSIFYTKVSYDAKLRTNNIYVVPSYSSWEDVNAFQPFANQCQLDEISKFLTERSSGLATIKISNFNLFPITVSAVVQVETGYTCEGVAKNIKQAINLFLSPWIDDNGPKITIGQELQSAALAKLIKNIKGVKEVNDTSYDPIVPTGEGTLIVSSMKHLINCKY